MSTPSLTRPAPFALTRGWSGTAMALALGLLALGLLFRAEVGSAVRVWSDSTAYNHCYLVLPIAAFLAWERRARLAVTPVVPMPRAMWLIMPLGVAWLIAERVGIMEGRQLVVLAMAEVLMLSVLGWRFCRAFAAPMIYLVFLVPFGAFLTGRLQDFTARFSIAGLNLLGIPNFSDGYTMEIPEGIFYVAEACAGLRFLIASVAFGTLYSFVIYRGVGRRLAFIGVSIVVPIIANGFRALGIVVLGHELGSAEAAAADHILYGWIFFSIVILLLTAAGLPFRQDREPIPVDATGASVVATGGRRAALLAALGVAALALIGPAVAGLLDAGSDRQAMALPADAMAGAGCLAAPDAPAARTAEDRRSGLPGVIGRYLCDDGRISLRVLVLPPRTSPSVVVEAQRQLIGAIGSEESDQRWLQLRGPSGINGEPPARHWLMTETETTNEAVATALWIDGRPARTGLSDRLAQARNSLTGATVAPVLMAASLQSDPTTNQRRSASRSIQAFLDANDAALSARAEAIAVIR